MGNQPEKFFDLSYIPEGFILQDPCRMKRPVAELLDHLRRRQSDNTVVTFAFKNVLANGKLVPASYSEVAILAMSKKKLQDGSPPPNPPPTVKPEQPVESGSPSHSRPTRALPPRIPCGAGEYQITASPAPAQSSSAPGSPCSDIYAPNDLTENIVSRAPSEAPIPQASSPDTPDPEVPSRPPTPEAAVLASVQERLVQAGAADVTLPPNASGSIVPPPNGHPFIFPNPQGHGYPMQQFGLNSNALPPAPPQSWEIYTPPGIMQAGGSIPIQPGFASGSTAQFYYIPTNQGWVQQPMQTAQYPNMQPSYAIPSNIGPFAPTSLGYPSANSQFDTSLDPLLRTAGTSTINAVSMEPKATPRPRAKPRVPDAPPTKYQDDSNFVHHRAQAHPFYSDAGTPTLMNSPPTKRKRQPSITDEQPLGKRQHVPRRTNEHFPEATEEDIRATAKLPRQRKRPS